MRRTVCLIPTIAGLFLLATLVCPGMAQDTKAKQETKAREEKAPEPDVVYVPTPHDVVTKMLQLAGVTKKDVLYDLGCGDGRIVVMAAKKYGCKATGFDIDPVRVRESRENVKRYKVESLASIRQQDVFKLDLAPASVVTLYLLPALNVRLIPQLEKLKPGSRIVSHDFDMEGVKPDKIIHLTSNEDNVEHTIYLWTVPLKKEPKAKEKE